MFDKPKSLFGYFIGGTHPKRKANATGFCWKLGISAKQFQVPNPLHKENQKRIAKIRNNLKLQIVQKPMLEA